MEKQKLKKKKKWFNIKKLPCSNFGQNLHIGKNVQQQMQHPQLFSMVLWNPNS